MEEKILLRGHHLLCIQGFRGYGYSKEFVDGMRAVVSRLKRAPDTPVEVVDSRDQICLSCPHLDGEACKEAGEGSNERYARHDRRVLDRLGLEIGQRVSWSVVLDRMWKRKRKGNVGRLNTKT